MFKKSFLVISAIGILFLVAPNLFAEGNGRLLTSCTWEGYVDYVARGCGVWDVGHGWVTIDGIPEGATIIRALMYWGGGHNTGDSTCFLNGHGA